MSVKLPVHSYRQSGDFLYFRLLVKSVFWGVFKKFFFFTAGVKILFFLSFSFFFLFLSFLFFFLDLFIIFFFLSFLKILFLCYSVLLFRFSKKMSFVVETAKMVLAFIQAWFRPNNSERRE